MKKKDLENVGTQIVEKKDGRKGQNSLWVGENAYTFKDDDEKKLAIHNAVVEATRYWAVEKVKDEEDAIQRIQEYFNHCAVEGKIPTVENLANCLGVTRVTLWEWENGEYRAPFDPNLIKRAKHLIATYDAEMVSSGKLNPVVYIFRGKNYYGLKDQQEYIVTPNVDTVPTETLIADAEALPETE
jgi:DNA-binding XRE family transcriptional regulator